MLVSFNQLQSTLLKKKVEEKKILNCLNFLQSQTVNDKSIFLVEESSNSELLLLDDLFNDFNNNIVGVIFLNDILINKAIFQDNSYLNGKVVFINKVKTNNIFTKSINLLFLDEVEVNYTIIALEENGKLNFENKLTALGILGYNDNITLNETIVPAIINMLEDTNENRISSSKYFIKDILKPTYFDQDNNWKLTELMATLKRGDSILKEERWLSKIEKKLNKWFISTTRNILDLSNLALNSLDDIPCIYKNSYLFENIEKLNLANNKISDVNDDILLFSNLTKINFTNCSLKQIPSIITNLDHLSELNVSYNSISTLKTAYPLPHLEVLNVEHCGFSKVEEEFYQLPKLKVLKLQNQKGRPALVIDKSIPTLEYLDLSLNYSADLLVAQSSLLTLKMNYCNHVNINNAILDCTQLQVFDFIAWDDMQALPSDFDKLNKLQRISFSIDYIDTDSLEVLDKIKTLKTLIITVENSKPFVKSKVKQNLEKLLELKNWEKIYCNEIMEDEYFIKQAKKRSNFVGILPYEMPQYYTIM